MQNISLTIPTSRTSNKNSPDTTLTNNGSIQASHNGQPVGVELPDSDKLSSSSKASSGDSSHVQRRRKHESLDHIKNNILGQASTDENKKMIDAVRYDTLTSPSVCERMKCSAGNAKHWVQAVLGGLVSALPSLLQHVYSQANTQHDTCTDMTGIKIALTSTLVAGTTAMLVWQMGEARALKKDYAKIQEVTELYEDNMDEAKSLYNQDFDGALTTLPDFDKKPGFTTKPAFQHVKVFAIDFLTKSSAYTLTLTAYCVGSPNNSNKIYIYAAAAGCAFISGIVVSGISPMAGTQNELRALAGKKLIVVKDQHADCVKTINEQLLNLQPVDNKVSKSASPDLVANLETAAMSPSPQYPMQMLTQPQSKNAKAMFYNKHLTVLDSQSKKAKGLGSQSKNAKQLYDANKDQDAFVKGLSSSLQDNQPSSIQAMVGSNQNLDAFQQKRQDAIIEMMGMGNDSNSDSGVNLEATSL